MNTPRTDSPSYLDHHYDMGDFQAPKRKVLKNDRSHHISSSSSTSMSIIDFMDPATLSPYATTPKKTITSFNFNTPTTNLSPCSTPKKTKRNREGDEETMPLRLQLPTLLSPATEDKLLYSPGLEESFAALEEECKDIECASIAMEEESSNRNNIRRRMIQANISPLSSPHPFTQNLVSPENLSPIILNGKGSSPRCPRTSPIKKRHLVVKNSNQYHHQEQQQKQRKKNERIPLTVPNLLMGLKYPTSSKQLKQEQQQQQQQTEGRTSRSNVSHNDNVNVKTKRGEIFPLHQEFLTTKKRKKNSEMNDFPLPSLKKQGGGKDNGSTDKITKNGATAMMMATYNNNNIIAKKAPSLETFRRKWDSLSKRKGHISEHRMSEAEQKQLLRDSFGKTMIRPPTNHRRKHY
jgi:hypothetical protein